ncbi:putative S-adenosyl-L-methionine-dependent methyltransferase [Medicago truncatula]|uniref:Putative S-adenosyl-L-methionine-dependent methyltransferase n=1 Tax=Medicago truncatula TaxID=3880 RepID=A0A072UNX2_MEDTR|nr:probable pectin methylesterase CGR2 [Medicago truncatula]KEH31539.1 transmembrane protein, putative [Medicago truncatula]RHN63073.1 putative S-adenosyl-L-methionine-dependent methyltransferase [Medicago truncatula]
MTRRQASSTRRNGGSFSFSGVLNSKLNCSPLLFITLVLLGAFLLIVYAYGGSGLFKVRKDVVSRVEGDFSCTFEVQSVIPILKNVYGENMKNILHVGPESCSVVSKLLKGEVEAWGVEPYDIEDVDKNCKALVHKGIIRVADIKFPLPYRPKSFSHVIVSDALDYMSPKYLNKTLPELVRVSADGVIIFTGYPGQRRAKPAQLSKFGRPAKMRSSSWWKEFFSETNLEENEVVVKKFEQDASRMSYNPTCQIFHIKSYN